MVLRDGGAFFSEKSLKPCQSVEASRARRRRLGHAHVDLDDGALLTMGVEYAYASAVPGHVAEFGTMSGATLTTLANAMRGEDQRYRLSEQRHGIGERSLYLFDSFEGLPQTNNPVDAASPHVATSVWGPGVDAWPDRFGARRRLFRHPRARTGKAWRRLVQRNAAAPSGDLRFARRQHRL